MKWIIRIVILALFLFFCCRSDDSFNETEEITGFLLPANALPDYEKYIDHAGIISQWNEEFYHRGLVIYRNHCFSCHGNPDQQGSLPSANKFWQDTFKLGNDPYAMYQVLTRGLGLMTPHVRLTPREKYEVIHFIREEFIRDDNPEQFFEVSEDYLRSLPPGDDYGPDPSPYQPWAEMDYGRFLIHTYELADSTHPPQQVSGGRSPLPNEDYRHLNFVYKGIAIRLDDGPGGIAAGKAFALFDHDLMRFAGFWTGEGFIDYRSILLNDEHNIYPQTVGKIHVENPITPGWANPSDGSFNDPRQLAVDGRPFGPLPRSWVHYKGLFTYNDRVVIEYTVGTSRVLETYDLIQTGNTPILSRTLNVAPSSGIKNLRIAPTDFVVEVITDKGRVSIENGFHVFHIPRDEAVDLTILMGVDAAEVKVAAANAKKPLPLTQFISGGPALYEDQTITSPIISGDDNKPYAVDVFTLPMENPWKSRMRPSGIDFSEDGEAAFVCTIDGEVYKLENIRTKEGPISWKRIATGMFQPLGIKIHNGNIYVGCRDQIVRLVDLNGDGETDYYESFNSDHQVTEHFHEFAMGLQTDEQGNFYYAKSGRHARRSLVPQHGTLIRVSADGTLSEILANGFRAANGVCINPDGSFYVTDQEGYWNPMNRINRVERGGFYGNMYGYNPPKDSSDQAMEQPLVWVDMKYDRSPAELLWVESNQWGPLNGHLLSLSYGYGKVFVVLPHSFGNIHQGAIVELPVPQFPTGLMRGRFNPADGQFYGCGMSAWATSQMIQTGGIYRIRYTGKDLNLPIEIKFREESIVMRFSSPLNKRIAMDPTRYQINTWELKRTRSYGSKRYDEKTLEIGKIQIQIDNEVILEIPDLQPTWIVEIKYQLEDKKGKTFSGAVQGTIHALEKVESL